MRLKLNFKCPIDWTDRSSSNQNDFCTHCQKTVHHADRLSEDDIKTLIQSDSACMRIRHHPNGQILTQGGLSKTLILSSALSFACWQEPNVPPQSPPSHSQKPPVKTSLSIPLQQIQSILKPHTPSKQSRTTARMRRAKKPMR